MIPAAGGGSILDIEREHEIHGTTLNSSYISISTTFTNPSSSDDISFGYLEMWDLMIALNDEAISRTIQPTTAWSGMFKSWNTPSFVALEVTDVAPPLSTFSIYVPFNSTVASSSMPDVFIYGEWSSVGYWGYVPSGGNDDSGVAFIYGPDSDNAITLAPGGSISFTQYITTSAESMNIPAVHENDWSPVSLLPLYRTNLASATERWSCIQESLPEDPSEEMTALIDEVSTFMGGATSLSNPVYASGQLGRALAVMNEIEEGLGIDCNA
ncbi:hypothetical protein EF808_04185 [archaeon]|nr:MAG: hypothetical protein EF808_04185 [archaeon]